VPHLLYIGMSIFLNCKLKLAKSTIISEEYKDSFRCTARQGDQIGRIFDLRAIVYFVIFFTTTYICASIFYATAVVNVCSSVDKLWVGLHFGRLFQIKSSGHSDRQPGCPDWANSPNGWLFTRGRYFENYVNSPHFWATLFYGKSYVLIWQKMCWTTDLTFFHKLIWSHCSLHTYVHTYDRYIGFHIYS
jgi:hypothetical protein